MSTDIVPGYARPANRLGQVALVAGVTSLAMCWTFVGGILLGTVALVSAGLNRIRLLDGSATNRQVTAVGGGLGLLGLVASATLLAHAFATMN